MLFFFNNVHMWNVADRGTSVLELMYTHMCIIEHWFLTMDMSTISQKMLNANGSWEHKLNIKENSYYIIIRSTTLACWKDIGIPP